MTVFNINEYRKSKVIVKDLEKILKIINATEASLKSYDKYRPVQHILTTLISQKPLIDIYLERYRIILDTKGSKGI